MVGGYLKQAEKKKRSVQKREREKQKCRRENKEAWEGIRGVEQKIVRKGKNKKTEGWERKRQRQTTREINDK